MFIDQRKNSFSPQQNSEKLLGKSLPANKEAERSVLGSLLLNDEKMKVICEMLLPEDFYLSAHKTIFTGIKSINARNERLDIVTLQNELEKKGAFASSGGLVYLLSLQEDFPVMGLIEQHATIVKENAVLRELVNSASSIIANCYTQEDQEISSLLDAAEKTIFTIANKRTQQSFVQLDIWLKRTFQHLSDLKSHGQGITGISSGYKKLDGMTSGFQNSDFIVLAARPSMGKTALALSLAHSAANSGHCVGFFSLEMGAQQLTLRMLSAESGIPHHSIRNALINSDQWIALTHAAGSLGELKLFIDDTATQTIMDIRTKARKLKTEHALSFLVIDYLQLIHSHKKHENRHQEVSDISRSLKALAKELDIPVIALSQLSRAVDGRVDKRPLLSDLRESGAIEQDADLIMFLYRDAVYNAETENPSQAELIVGKQRNGPTGTVMLNFARELTRFEDID